MRRGDLDDLAAFAAVAQERSFTRAAAGLGMSPSALSHAMRALEGRIGGGGAACAGPHHPERRAHGGKTAAVALVGAGALDEVARGLSSLAALRGEPAGSICLTTFAYAARTVLAPALPRFLLDHPLVSVEVDVDDRPVDLVAAGFDAGIRFGEAVERDMVAVRVGPDLRTVVVGSPDYFERHPPPSTPAELDRHNCINYRLPGSGGLLPSEFEADGRETRIRASGRLVVNNEALAFTAIRGGAGLGYVLEDDVTDDVAAGQLVPVLERWCSSFPGCYLN